MHLLKWYMTLITLRIDSMQLNSIFFASYSLCILRLACITVEHCPQMMGYVFWRLSFSFCCLSRCSFTRIWNRYFLSRFAPLHPRPPFQLLIGHWFSDWNRSLLRQSAFVSFLSHSHLPPCLASGMGYYSLCLPIQVRYLDNRHVCWPCIVSTCTFSPFSCTNSKPGSLLLCLLC